MVVLACAAAAGGASARAAAPVLAPTPYMGGTRTTASVGSTTSRRSCRSRRPDRYRSRARRLPDRVARLRVGERCPDELGSARAQPRSVAARPCVADWLAPCARAARGDLHRRRAQRLLRARGGLLRSLPAGRRPVRGLGVRRGQGRLLRRGPAGLRATAAVHGVRRRDPRQLESPSDDPERLQLLDPGQINGRRPTYADSSYANALWAPAVAQSWRTDTDIGGTGKIVFAGRAPQPRRRCRPPAGVRTGTLERPRLPRAAAGDDVALRRRRS